MTAVTHPAYRRSVLYTVLWIGLVATMATVTLVLTWSAEPRSPTYVGFVVATGIVPMAVSLLLLGRMTIEVDATTLRWGFGWLHWPRWQLPLTDIVAVERTVAPKTGSGIRIGPKGARSYTTVLGGPALRLTLRDGATVVLGTDEPDRLAAFIRARL
jgi:hypothetical protein